MQRAKLVSCVERVRRIGVLFGKVLEASQGLFEERRPLLFYGGSFGQGEPGNCLLKVDSLQKFAGGDLARPDSGIPGQHRASLVVATLPKTQLPDRSAWREHSTQNGKKGGRKPVSPGKEPVDAEN